MIELPYCASCGKQVSEGDIYCKNCGQPVSLHPSSTAGSPTSRKLEVNAMGGGIRSGLRKVISLVQIVLALVGLYLLFGSAWAWYNAPGYPLGYRTFYVWYNAPSTASMGLLTAGFTVLLFCVALFGLMWGWLSSNQNARKYSKLTIIFGFLLILLSAVAVGVVVMQRTSQFPDACPTLAACNVPWGLSTALTGFLIGGFLFVVIGFIGTRITRLSQAARQDFVEQDKRSFSVH